MPWVVLGALALGAKLGKQAAAAGFTIACGYYLNRLDIIGLTVEIVISQMSGFVFCWMFGCVSVFIPLLWWFKIEDKLLLRKLFHVVALVTFFPGVAQL